MKSRDELIEINIKNDIRSYFNDIIKIEDSGFNNILLHEKSYKITLVYVISYKNFIFAKAVRIR